MGTGVVLVVLVVVALRVVTPPRFPPYDGSVAGAAAPGRVTKVSWDVAGSIPGELAACRWVVIVAVDGGGDAVRRATTGGRPVVARRDRSVERVLEQYGGVLPAGTVPRARTFVLDVPARTLMIAWRQGVGVAPPATWISAVCPHAVYGIVQLESVGP